MSNLVSPRFPTKRSSRRTGGRGMFDEAGLLIDLANMRDDGVANFRKRWGSIYGRYSAQNLIRFRGELQLLWNHVAPLDESEWRDESASATMEEVCSGLTEYQKRLFEHWHNET